MDARLKLIELYAAQRIKELEEEVQRLKVENQDLQAKHNRDETSWILRLADLHEAIEKSKRECGLDD